jgi:hypothetical protein
MLSLWADRRKHVSEAPPTTDSEGLLHFTAVAGCPPLIQSSSDTRWTSHYSTSVLPSRLLCLPTEEALGCQCIFVSPRPSTRAAIFTPTVNLPCIVRASGKGQPPRHCGVVLSTKVCSGTSPATIRGLVSLRSFFAGLQSTSTIVLCSI